MYYGSREGNRKANVLRIFRSNRSVLESPDKIFPGQKLVIPSLWASGTRLKAIEKIFPTSMFEQVESIGRTHL
jgi:LysM repeat protein